MFKPFCYLSDALQALFESCVCCDNMRFKHQPLHCKVWDSTGDFAYYHLQLQPKVSCVCDFKPLTCIIASNCSSCLLFAHCRGLQAVIRGYCSSCNTCHTTYIFLQIDNWLSNQGIASKIFNLFNLLLQVIESNSNVQLGVIRK